MLLGLVLLAIVSAVPLLGGRLTALAEVRFRGTWIIGVAIAAQIVIISVVPGGGDGLHKATHVATYLLAGVFVWVNRAIPGLLLAAAGGGANFLAIFANGGVMPALPSALRTAGIEQHAGEFANSTAVHAARLQFLGDVFAIPASWPAANVFSVGDVLILLGSAFCLHRVSGSRGLAWLRRPVRVERFEAWPVGTARALLRLTARPTLGERLSAVWTHDSTGEHRHAALPGPEASVTVGFAVPATATATGAPVRFVLETSFGGLHPLPAPRTRR